jgi:DNA repair protein RadC
MTRAADDATIDAALTILARRLEQKRSGNVVADPKTVREFLKLRYADRPVEVFGAILVDGCNRVIEVREVSQGTVSQTVVYPREMVRAAIEANAAAVILFHNHPSQRAEPSPADRMMTDSLRHALHTVDVRCLDHLIVAGTKHYSFAENGLI